MTPQPRQPRPGTPASAPADGGERTTTLGDLERRATAGRQEHAYGADALIACDRLVRIFSGDGVEVQALQGLDLLVHKGELTALVGASGSGKSTLLNILAGLDTPSAGSASVAGHDLPAMDARTRLHYRRKVVGFIWQRTARNLLPYLTAAQNVALPMTLSAGGGRPGAGGPRRGRARAGRALELLDLLGVADHAGQRPAQLSGGQQQRVAIAVALANDPSVVLADEPTGELDTATATEVFAALRRANSELGTTILVVTHDSAVSAQVNRTVSIRDGRTSTETLRTVAPDEEGGAAGAGREYTTIDRSGRLQLPPEFTTPLAIRDRVLLELRPDHIQVRPGERTRPEETQAPAAGTEPGAGSEGGGSGAGGKDTADRQEEEPG
ncbi:ATP-binding cassette domain-containing protein [Streptomyces diacarni]|uniref:ATP-binding cassette domain-containing protein n=1 Tax=Streptomyces diacarni TaxID=2800381 RepID=A0A367F8N1_9ACTN|nr:ATP-binding cassette domain-containing protein [Streptomyces diacarni]RCG26047.1 ATP-binding cassette domain-containing protein [Streptomyces diacarni]